MVQMDYRLDKDTLLEALKGWNSFLKRKVNLIACGGTAMTLLGVKPSTKDVDFMAPNVGEYDYLLKTLRSLGYKAVSGNGWRREGENIQFDLFRGNKIHTTELLESPLCDRNHTPLFELSRIYVGVLNDYDLISSKLMRGTPVDYDDCIKLFEAHSKTIDFERLSAHYKELVSYDISVDRISKNIDIFVEKLKESGLA